MQILYKLQLKDYVSAQYSHQWRKTAGPLILVLNYIVFPVLGALGIYEWIHAGHQHPDLHRSVMIPALCLLLCLFPLILYFNLRRCYKLTRGSDGRCIIDFQEDNLYAEVPGHSRSVFEWSAVKNYCEGKSTLLIYFAPTLFLAIPKRFLGNL
jgi:hypothetical protein